MDTKKFFTRREVADILSINIVTVARRMADGTIPYTKIGNHVLIPVEFLDQLTEKALVQEAK